jgi:DNA replication protein DnaC
MDADLSGMLRYLRLTNLLARWDEYLQVAATEEISPVRLLRHVLEEECRVKRDHARERRLRRARIPEVFTLQTYPFERQPKLDKKRLLAVYDAFDFVEKAQNIVWLGPTGCGKTGLATSFLVEAVNRGHSGRSVRFPELVSELYASVADHSEEALLKRYLSYRCLLVDEIGFVQVEPVQVGLFFTLMHRRHRVAPTLVTSNLGFDEWRTFLENDHLTAALVDRLTENSYVFNMKNCKSLRPKLSEERPNER